MGKNQVLFLSQMEESKMAKQVHIRVDDDIYKELSDYSVVSGQSMQDCLSVAIRQMLVKAKEEPSQDCNGYTFIDLFCVLMIRENEISMKTLMRTFALLIYLQVLAVCDLHSNQPVGAVFILTNGISTASRPITQTLVCNRTVILQRFRLKASRIMIFL